MLFWQFFGKNGTPTMHRVNDECILLDVSENADSRFRSNLGDQIARLYLGWELNCRATAFDPNRSYPYHLAWV